MRWQRALIMTTCLLLCTMAGAGCDLERTRERSAAAEEEADQTEPSWPDSAVESERAVAAPAPSPGEAHSEPSVEEAVVEVAATVEPTEEAAAEPSPETPRTPMPPAIPPVPGPPTHGEVDWEAQIDQATLNGRWVGGHPGEYEMLVQVDGTLVSAIELGGARETLSTLFELVSAEGPHAVFRAASDGRIVDVHALFLTANEVLVWLMGESELGVLRRVGEMPDELLGQWQVVRTGGDLGPRTLVIEPAQFRVPDESETVPAYPLESAGETLEVVAAPADGRRLVVAFRRMAEGVYLSWSLGRAEFEVLYREGARPAWLGGMSPGTDESAVPSEPPPPGPSGGLARTEVTAPPEVQANLRYIAEMAVTYFQTDHFDVTGALVPSQFPRSTDWTPEAEECGMVFAGTAPWQTPTWRALMFEPVGPQYFQYRFISEDPTTFEVQARVDADCDGVYHKLSIAGFAGGEIGAESIIEDNAGE